MSDIKEMDKVPLKSFFGALDWAFDEVKLACKSEYENDEDGTAELCVASYKSALKAFEVLINDFNKGDTSLSLSDMVLRRLINRQPLTPIEDIPEAWEDVSWSFSVSDAIEHYRCKRLYTLHKKVYPDGSIKYYDTKRISRVDMKTLRSTCNDSFVSDLVNDLIPIKFPYFPSYVPIKAYCRSVLAYEENNDYDTLAVFYVRLPSGKGIEINKFFKEIKSEDGRAKWEPITETEYLEREKLEYERRELTENVAEVASLIANDLARWDFKDE